MLIMHISEDDTPMEAAPDPNSPAGLAACLAQYGVAPAMIQTTLVNLPQRQTIVLYKACESAAWEIVPSRLLSEPSASAKS